MSIPLLKRSLAPQIHCPSLHPVAKAVVVADVPAPALVPVRVVPAPARVAEDSAILDLRL